MSVKKAPQIPLYVKLPSAAVERLDRAAEALGVPKKQIVAELVTRYLEVGSSKPGGTPDRGPTIGTYSFQPYDPPEVMNAEQAGELLQISEKNVLELAEAGQLPGKKLGPVWRFSRAGLVAWLASPQQVKK